MDRGSRPIFAENNGLSVLVERIGAELQTAREASLPSRIGVPLAERRAVVQRVVDDMVATVCDIAEGGGKDMATADSTTAQPMSVDGPEVVSGEPQTEEKTADAEMKTEAEKREVCVPERKSLLKVLMRLMLGCLREPSLTTALRNIIEGEWLQYLETLIRCCSFYGTTLWNLATRWVAEFCNNEPNLLPVLQANGTTGSILEVLQKSVPVSGDVLAELPSVLSALCLNQAGLDAFIAANPIDGLLPVFVDQTYLGCMSSETPELLGTALDELMRHQPSLREPGIAATINLLEKLIEIGNDPNIVINTGA